MSIDPNYWQYLQDEEIITADCMCFGELEDDTIGWGKAPIWLIGQPYCVGYISHPDLIAKKTRIQPQDIMLRYDEHRPSNIC